jgi:thioredoxin
MRKIVVASLALILIAFTACGNQSKDKATEKKAENITTNETKKMGTIKLTKAEFMTKVANYEANPSEWKYLGDKPCIIDFYADWCGPCKTIAPILEDLAKEYDGQIYVYKVDTEKEQELAAAFGIRSIPSLLFVPMNEQPQMAMGALPKETFKKAIEEVLLKKAK